MSILSSQKKKSPKEIILLMNLPPVLHFHAGKPSLFCFAGMQSFQATLPHLHVDQFIHFHPRLTQQIPLNQLLQLKLLFVFFVIICFTLRKKNPLGMFLMLACRDTASPLLPLPICTEQTSALTLCSSHGLTLACSRDRSERRKLSLQTREKLLHKA